MECGKDAQGKRRRRSYTVRGAKADAERQQRKLVEEAERDIRSGKNAAAAPILVRDWVERYLEEVVRLYPSITTYERYTSAARLHIFPTVGDVPLKELSTKHIRIMDRALANGATSRKGLSPRSILIAHTVLSGAYEYAIEMDKVDHNPLRSGQRLRALRKKITPPEMLPVKQLLNLARVEQHSLFTFIYVLNYTAMRRGEAMALDWSCVDWDQRVINVRVAAKKTHTHGMLIEAPKSLSGIRAIALDVGTVEVLRRHQESQIAAGVSNGRVGLVFPASDGKLMKPTTMLRHLKELGARVGLPDITFHSFRHFHISVLLQAKENLAVVAERAGHSDPSVTLRQYAHVFPGWQEGAADAFASAMGDDG